MLNDLSSPWAGENCAYWYRAEGVTYAAPLDEFGWSQGSGRSEIRMFAAAVVRRTPKGVWLAGGPYSFTQPRFVRNDSRKKWAHPTKKEALKGLIAKKQRQIKILRGQTAHAQKYLDMAEAILNEVT